MKQINASKNRKNAIVGTSLFNQVHSAHHKHVVKENRKQKCVSQLQQLLTAEQYRDTQQAHKVLRNCYQSINDWS